MFCIVLLVKPVISFHHVINFPFNGQKNPHPTWVPFLVISYPMSKYQFWLANWCSKKCLYPHIKYNIFNGSCHKNHKIPIFANNKNGHSWAECNLTGQPLVAMIYKHLPSIQRLEAPSETTDSRVVVLDGATGRVMNQWIFLDERGWKEIIRHFNR